MTTPPVAWAQSSPTHRVAGNFRGYFAKDGAHPAIRGPTDADFGRIWGATCRIATPTGTGSGFFVQGPRWYAVTCAHVVDGCDNPQVERVIGGDFVESFPGRVVALDYSHDLAIVEYDVTGSSFVQNWPIPELPLGTPPVPGDQIVMCGYPAGVDTPRLATGLVSGYDVFHLDGVPIVGPVLDASVNGGNSGGPICSLGDEGPAVVGIISARPSTLPIGFDGHPELVALFERINANNGIGFALDPTDVESLLNTHAIWTKRTQRREYRKYEPSIVELPKVDFVDVQVQCRTATVKDVSRSPIGVFSFGRDWKLHLGWYGESDCVPLHAPGWRRALKAISQTGGSFILRGTEVLLYRQRYGGYIVPVKLELS